MIMGDRLRWWNGAGL